MLPQDVQIIGNIAQVPEKAHPVVNRQQPGVDVQWKDNKFFGGTLGIPSQSGIMQSRRVPSAMKRRQQAYLRVAQETIAQAGPQK